MWLAPSLPRARAVLPAGTWTIATAIDSVTLDFESRHRRRLRMTTDGGLAFLLDLAQATLLRQGDGLQLESGRCVAVHAAPETLLEVHCGTASDLVRVAWHVGNRHLLVQVLAGALRLRDDHVIADMLRGLGARVTKVEAPFEPESGAYAAAPHGHGHEHDNGHGHG